MDQLSRYLLEQYDTNSKLLPPKSNPVDRYKAYEWVHAAEGTFMLHALAILYARVSQTNSITRTTDGTI